MLWTYALEAFAEQLHQLKIVGDEVIPMEEFSGTKTYITLKLIIHKGAQFMSRMQ